MMRPTKTFFTMLLLVITAIGTKAQDIVVISQGNFLRGTIQATDFSTVILTKEDESVAQYKASDIQEFVWNGETYVSKPIVIKNKMEHRFFKLLVQGAVNLYAIGGRTGSIDPPTPKKRSRIRPSIGVGAGSGGFGGVGMGGSIAIGGGRNREEAPVRRVMPSTFFIEKFGTGPMMELPVEANDTEGKNQQIKNALLQKLTNDEDLAERIKATETFDGKLVRGFVEAYNAAHK